MSQNAWQHHDIQVNGIRMHYVQAGHVGAAVDPKIVTLILLHGWPEFWYAWHKLIPLLEDRFAIIAPDLRGFGQTEKPPGSALEAYRLEDHVADISALIDTLGLRNVGIVSHDVGAMVAQGLAQSVPEKLAGLFFFNVPYPGIGSRWAAPEHLNDIWYQGFHQQPWAAELLATSRDAIRVYFANMLSAWAHDPHTFDDDIEAWVDNFAEPGNLQGGFNWYSAIFPRRLKIMQGAQVDWPVIDVPTCVRWGEHEPFMLIEYADRLGEFFSDLDFAVAPDAGHFVHYEKPDYAAREIEAFFTRLAARA